MSSLEPFVLPPRAQEPSQQTEASQTLQSYGIHLIYYASFEYLINSDVAPYVERAGFSSKLERMNARVPILRLATLPSGPPPSEQTDNSNAREAIQSQRPEPGNANLSQLIDRLANIMLERETRGERE
jgi:hypothetical protein